MTVGGVREELRNDRKVRWDARRGVGLQLSMLKQKSKR